MALGLPFSNQCHVHSEKQQRQHDQALWCPTRELTGVAHESFFAGDLALLPPAGFHEAASLYRFALLFLTTVRLKIGREHRRIWAFFSYSSRLTGFT
jgi:hypothetical protein